MHQILRQQKLKKEELLKNLTDKHNWRVQNISAQVLNRNGQNVLKYWPKLPKLKIELYEWFSSKNPSTAIYSSVIRIGATFATLAKNIMSLELLGQFILNLFGPFIVFLNGPFPASFSLFSSFQYTVDSKQMFNNFCRWLDWNLGPLVSEVTALPTEPHNHCAISCIFNLCK